MERTQHIHSLIEMSAAPAAGSVVGWDILDRGAQDLSRDKPKSDRISASRLSRLGRQFRRVRDYEKLCYTSSHLVLIDMNGGGTHCPGAQGNRTF